MVGGFFIPTTASVVAEAMDLAQRPGLGPQLKVTLDWVPITIVDGLAVSKAVLK